MSTVAIIGSGASGLASCKEALACHLIPMVFEKKATIGGGWSPEGFAPPTLRTNISYHNCMFSDFEWKQGTPDFPNQEQFYAYLCEYASSFKLHPYIHLNAEVQKATPSQKHWTIEWICQGVHHSQTFDYLIVCSGIFSKAHIPKIPGLETFPGPIHHSSNLKTTHALDGKTVAVIGTAFSGSEFASKIALETTAKVINVMRQPKWILPRYLPKADNAEEKLPLDLLFYNRSSSSQIKDGNTTTANDGKNRWLQNFCAKQAEIASELSMDNLFSKPPFVTISDNYLEQVQQGKIRIQLGSIDKIEGQKLFFQNGSMNKVDALVFCTGYQTALPFFDQEILNTLDYLPEEQFQPLLLHKTVFPPARLPHLAFVGFCRGPFLAQIELEARWIIDLICRNAFPCEQEINRGIQSELELRKTYPRPQFPHGNYVGMCEELAKEVGVLPDFEKLKIKNPSLYQKLWFGPFTAASYRLQGPGSDLKLALKVIDQVTSLK